MKMLSYISKFLSLAYLIRTVSHFQAQIVNVTQEKDLMCIGPLLPMTGMLRLSIRKHRASQLLIWGKFNLLNLYDFCNN